MTARSLTVTRWAIRFLVALACYAGTTTVWVYNGIGWESLNLFVAAFAYGIILLPCWCAAVAIEHFYFPSARVRLIIHPAIVTVLFAAASAIVLTQYFGDPVESMWRETQPFAALVAACAFIDAAVDMLVENTLTPALQTAS